jgi:hypothetical protein
MLSLLPKDVYVEGELSADNPVPSYPATEASAAVPGTSMLRMFKPRMLHRLFRLSACQEQAVLGGHRPSGGA